MVQPGLTLIPERGFGAVFSLILVFLLSMAGCTMRSLNKDGGSGAGVPDDRYQAAVVWAWIHGSENMSAPPFLSTADPSGAGGIGGFGSPALTIDLNLVADASPTLGLVLIHCDRNWKPTESVFIQDRTRLRSTDFIVETAPIGVLNYDYSATITFPSETNTIDVEHSGNYIARIINYYDGETVLAELRFFAVESTAGVRLEMISDFYESAWTDKVQEGLRARTEITPGPTSFSTQFQAVHLYEQGKWLYPMVADENSRSRTPAKGEYRATWSPFYGRKVVADFFNIPSGNEHRILDLTDMVEYPSNGGVLTTRLSDQPRYASYSEQDNNGLVLFPYVSPEDNDLVYFEFRLDLDGEEIYDDMAVVGSFNNWTPSYDWRLVYNSITGQYAARGWVKRAMHEYEYVNGRWNVDSGILEQAEATLLEGNNVYASQTWYALAYYRDQTALSYDRIVGVGTDISGGR